MSRRALPLLAAGLAALAAAPATAAAAPAPASPGGAAWRPGVEAARTWAASRQGYIAFAVRTREGVVGVGLDRPYPAASVVKAMLLVAYLRQPDVRRRPLRAEERALLGPMVRRSSNRAATEIRNRIGNAALARLARVTGMRSFRVAQNWGSSTITARDQTRFFLHIDAQVPARHRAYAMGLLETIVPRQRWGIAQAIPAGWTLWFKGGWGSGSGAVDNQVGLLRQSGERVAIAVLTLSNPSHAYGRATEQGLARRLLAGLDGELVGTVVSARAGLPARRVP
jgi:beta-lactamase class A